MLWTVGWKNQETKRMKREGIIPSVEAKDWYDAKIFFLDTKVKGTPWESNYDKNELLRMVSAKRHIDARERMHLGEDFNLEAFIDEIADKEEVLA